MKIDDKRIEELVETVRNQFPSMGGGRIQPGNPISVSLAQHKPMFGGGVDIEQVVRFIIEQI